MAENAGKNTFFLRVIAADRVFFKGKCTYVVLPAVDGEHAIMAHHSDMMIATDTGTIRFQTEDGAWQEAVIGTGFTQVINNRVTILVEFAERPERLTHCGRGKRRNVRRSSSGRSRVCRSIIIRRPPWQERWRGCG